MAILDFRIDDRLIHGQVCNLWIPQYSLERIAIIDDEIVNDEVRKTALKFGCPAKCKLSIFSTDKAADKFKRGIDEGYKVMILCNSPVWFLKTAEAGYNIPYISIGNMSTKPDAVQVKKTVFISPEEKDAFTKLAEMGTKVYYHMVPNEPREDITELIQNIKY